MADPAPLDLADQPARREADRPTGVGMDLLAGLDPAEETLVDQLDVPAHATTEVHEMDLDVITVTVDQLADLVDVGGRTGRGVDVNDEAALACRAEDLLELRGTVRVSWSSPDGGG
jgi:hypothetical protein